jgi:hypothetical protein
MNYQILNMANAVTAEGQLVSHHTYSVFSTADKVRTQPQGKHYSRSHVKRKFPRMRVFWRSIWHYHLSQGKAIEDGSNLPTVIERDRRDRDAFSGRERCQDLASTIHPAGASWRLTDMHFPPLPFQNMTVQFETDTFRL